MPLRQFQVLDRKVELSAAAMAERLIAEARMLVRERGFRVVLD